MDADTPSATTAAPSTHRFHLAPQAHQIGRGTTVKEPELDNATPELFAQVSPGFTQKRSQLPKLIAQAASLRDGRRGLLWSTAATGWRRPGGVGRHTRAWLTGAPAIVADCRRLRYLPPPCPVRWPATVNKIGNC